MNKQSLAIGFGTGLLIAIVLLWLRVRELEKTVHALSQRPSAAPSVVSLSKPEPENETEKQQVFKLIDAARKTDSGKSKVGIPWDVERAMMGGARNGHTPEQQGEWHSEVQVPPSLDSVPAQPEFLPELK
jgi:hypothetical protein